jgi:hypothetical protein
MGKAALLDPGLVGARDRRARWPAGARPVAGRGSRRVPRQRRPDQPGSSLSAYFYSRDIGRIWRVAEALEYGIVGINEGIIWIEIAPFGGMKEYGIEEFLEVKCLCMGGIDR